MSNHTTTSVSPDSTFSFKWTGTPNPPSGTGATASITYVSTSDLKKAHVVVSKTGAKFTDASVDCSPNVQVFPKGHVLSSTAAVDPNTNSSFFASVLEGLRSVLGL